MKNMGTVGLNPHPCRIDNIKTVSSDMPAFFTKQRLAAGFGQNPGDYTAGKTGTNDEIII